ncbi:acyl-CoA dehydrogenase [Rhodococcoides fascians]|uniref:acyl-CoA dehydrogenase family protein n=1 Tax=Rhodococcoides fascians TaxID=1828 RepID=UPI000B9C0498|nr:acyl-CoA dehydrogenase family protein [Rhodococcus fascians]OZD69020.1 acyl-CoA dehydrogenase [Rhodococcus sp. 06-1059B-a]OZE81426.1 acyl-CoA dehydrogenase [Rhodococcus fascians]OZF10250.1 acyl-CoA dehydrogenase [Rhodococcus fascians]OZF13340.1 acyl-CoA dehydrogenase [Rhodococcus fascians]OZF59438.1 acyl-CoA dehydrogenase [Rhodococcus fascians]
MSNLRLEIDSNSKAYVALHNLLDESVADAMLTKREREVRAISREVVSREVAPRAADLDSTHRFAHEGVQALASANLCGLIFPEYLGGTGDTNVAYAVVMEEIAAGCAATSLVFMTQMHAAYPILIAGTDEQKRRHIPGLLDASRYGSLAITEPAAGSDVASLSTVASPADSGWLLSGQKTFITTGDRADVMICFATVDKRRGRDGITAFIVEGDWPGIRRGQPFRKMGMNGSTTAEIFYDRVAVPSENLLGNEGGGWSVVMRSVVKSRISAAAQGVGLARAAYARTLAALTALYGNRVPDEATTALADLRGRILQGRLLLHAVARQVDVDPSITAGQIGVMKQACTDLGFQVSVEASRILGPYGDLTSLGVERCVRDAKVTQIYDGTNEIQRMLIGRETMRALKESE